MVDGGRSCALYYLKEAYEADKPRVVGRQAAGAGFLDGWVRYSGADEFFCFAADDRDLDEFRDQVHAVRPGATTALVRPSDVDLLSTIGCVYQPGPIISETAWLRRHHDEAAFSICGITHSVATERVVRGIRDFLTAPTHPWDALICTSQAARAAVDRILESWRTYLERRGFGVPDLAMEVDVIPLGVHPERFDRDDAARARGAALRRELGIDEDDVVALYFGRLDVQTKSHPSPMFRALELARRRQPHHPLTLLLVGQFADPMTAHEIGRCRRLCPGVNVVHVDGMNVEAARDAWAAADLFVSLSDNVQESFGLTPVEAMAASLPCVVSDWNGYRETVVDGETGFLIGTRMPPPGAGADLAVELGRRAYDYHTYLAAVSQSTAVDVDACAAAIARLVGDAELRARMGEAGRRRVEQHFHWRGVIARYVELFAELAARRATASRESLRRRDEPVHPDYADPYWVFEGHPTRALGPDDVVCVADVDAPYVLGDLRQSALHVFAERTHLPRGEIDRIVADLAAAPTTVAQLLESRPAAERDATLRTIGWLAKFGVVRFG